MIRFMLDTNICVDVLRRNDRIILGHFDSCQAGEIAISSIVLAELQHFESLPMLVAGYDLQSEWIRKHKPYPCTQVPVPPAITL